jgi:DNA polymerase-3 subunit beta
MASTDSYRLAERKLNPNSEAVRLLVPATAMQDLLRIIGDGTDDVIVTHDDQQILFQVGDVELVTRLVEGKYPDYQKLIPSSFATSATLKRADLVNVTKVSSLFARESAGSITIEVNEDSQTLSIRSVASQLGENTAQAAAKTVGSESITLNSRYLLDALNAVSGDEVTFGFNGKLEATLLTDASNPDYKHVIMPLKG